MFYPFAKRLNIAPAPGERLRVERMLAGARLFLALASLLAIYLDPTEPTRYTTLAYGLMFGYLAHSVVIFAWLRRSQQVSLQFTVGLQAIDIAWPALISLFTEGPNSPF